MFFTVHQTTKANLALGFHGDLLTAIECESIPRYKENIL